jgi:hypothetical protein
MQVNPKDFAGGLLFVAIGAFFALNAWFNLRIGRATNMGPGYFPVLLGVLLVGFGLVIAVGSIRRPAEAFGKVSWRGVVLVLAAVVFFGYAVRSLGFAPTLAVATLMAAMAPDTAKPLPSLLFAVAVAVLGTLIFVYALRLPYPVFGPWLTWIGGNG